MKKRPGFGIPRPMFTSLQDMKDRMKAMDEDLDGVSGEALKRESHPKQVCAWCDESADPTAGTVAGEVFCAEHHRAAVVEAAVSGGELVTWTRSKRAAFRAAKDRLAKSGGAG
jgi:hypothetical protein